MAKNIIIAGKDYNKNSKIQAISKQLGLNAFVTGSTDDSKTLWNRNSPISARSIIINAENSFEKIDAGVIFFETSTYSQIFTNSELQDYNRVCDELILGYQFLTLEFLRRFEKKQHGKLFFVLQPVQTQADFLRLSTREQIASPSYISTIISTAQQAFLTFAENIAAANYKENGCPIYLIETSPNTSEQQILEWISSKIEEPNPVYKNSKQAVTWQSPDEKSKFFGK